MIFIFDCVTVQTENSIFSDEHPTSVAAVFIWEFPWGLFLADQKDEIYATL